MFKRLVTIMTLVALLVGTRLLVALATQPSAPFAIDIANFTGESPQRNPGGTGNLANFGTTNGTYSDEVTEPVYGRSGSIHKMGSTQSAVANSQNQVPIYGASDLGDPSGTKVRLSFGVAISSYDLSSFLINMKYGATAGGSSFYPLNSFLINGNGNIYFANAAVAKYETGRWYDFDIIIDKTNVPTTGTEKWELYIDGAKIAETTVTLSTSATELEPKERYKYFYFRYEFRPAASKVAEVYVDHFRGSNMWDGTAHTDYPTADRTDDVISSTYGLNFVNGTITKPESGSNVTIQSFINGLSRSAGVTVYDSANNLIAPANYGQVLAENMKVQIPSPSGVNKVTLIVTEFDDGTFVQNFNELNAPEPQTSFPVPGFNALSLNAGRQVFTEKGVALRGENDVSFALDMPGGSSNNIALEKPWTVAGDSVFEWSAYNPSGGGNMGMWFRNIGGGFSSYLPTFKGNGEIALGTGVGAVSLGYYNPKQWNRFAVAVRTTGTEIRYDLYLNGNKIVEDTVAGTAPSYSSFGVKFDTAVSRLYIDDYKAYYASVPSAIPASSISSLNEYYSVSNSKKTLALALDNTSAADILNEIASDVGTAILGIYNENMESVTGNAKYGDALVARTILGAEGSDDAQPFFHYYTLVEPYEIGEVDFVRGLGTNTVTATFPVTTRTPDSLSASIILASYNGGKLVDVKVKNDTVSGSTVGSISESLTLVGEEDTIKAFLWSDLVNLQPISSGTIEAQMLYTNIKSLSFYDENGVSTLAGGKAAWGESATKVVRLHFTRPMNEASVLAAGNISLYQGTTPVSITDVTYSAEDNTADVTLGEVLLTDKKYAVVGSTGLADAYGESLTEEKRIEFYTEFEELFNLTDFNAGSLGGWAVVNPANGKIGYENVDENHGRSLSVSVNASITANAPYLVTSDTINALLTTEGTKKMATGDVTIEHELMTTGADVSINMFMISSNGFSTPVYLRGNKIQYSDTTIATLKYNQWHQIRFTYNLAGKSCTIYVDGEEVYSGELIGNADTGEGFVNLRFTFINSLSVQGSTFYLDNFRAGVAKKSE